MLAHRRRLRPDVDQVRVWS